MLERKKFCPVCGGLTAVLNGNPERYGEKAVGWNRFIALKYCSDECRDIMKRQDTLLSNRRRRKEKKAYRNALTEAVDVLREEVRVSRARIAELEAKS